MGTEKKEMTKQAFLQIRGNPEKSHMAGEAPKTIRANPTDPSTMQPRKHKQASQSSKNLRPFRQGSSKNSSKVGPSRLRTLLLALILSLLDSDQENCCVQFNKVSKRRRTSDPQYESSSSSSRKRLGRAGGIERKKKR